LLLTFAFTQGHLDSCSSEEEIPILMAATIPQLSRGLFQRAASTKWFFGR
jgi:hypothetical protein